MGSGAQMDRPLLDFDLRAELLERDFGVVARADRLADDGVALREQAGQQNAALDLRAGHGELVIDAMQRAAVDGERRKLSVAAPRSGRPSR